KVRVGVDPLGGASVAYWDAIGGRYHIDLEVVNHTIDPTFRFMMVDWDGHIRMDPSSPYAMAAVGRRRQDAGQQQSHRPRRGAPAATARRGSGRVQVVRRWADRGLGRFLRGGELGSDVPATRWHGLDHRQGRPDPEPAC